MSLYNMIHGATPAVFFILPALGKHPEQYPRFRDCFTHDDDHPEYDNTIQIYTRVGGGNREGYAAEIEEMRAMPGFIADFDDSFDSTFATFVFSIPETWKDDINLVMSGKIKETSQEYKDMLIAIFPKLSEKLKQILY
jgi:hypothetical protein